MVPESCGQCGKGGREELLSLAVGSTSLWKRGEGAVMLRAGKDQIWCKTWGTCLMTLALLKEVVGWRKESGLWNSAPPPPSSPRGPRGPAGRGAPEEGGGRGGRLDCPSALSLLLWDAEPGRGPRRDPDLGVHAQVSRGRVDPRAPRVAGARQVPVASPPGTSLPGTQPPCHSRN